MLILREIEDLSYKDIVAVTGISAGTAMPRLSAPMATRAAAIVYRRDKHVINLLAFVSNDRSDAAPNLEAQNGFNIVRWRMSGLSYLPPHPLRI
jgi:hypothetical protein